MVWRGGALQSLPVVQVRGLRIDLERREVTIDGRAVDLTLTEYELLRALAQNPNHAFTRGELIDQAPGYAYEGSERPIDSHVKNLRRKIERDPVVPEYVETVFGMGASHARTTCASWGWTSPGPWWRRWAGASAWRACRGRAAASGSACRL
jgi:DNA-binding response OmpR family regulator